MQALADQLLEMVPAGWTPREDWLTKWIHLDIKVHLSANPRLGRASVRASNRPNVRVGGSTSYGSIFETITPQIRAALAEIGAKGVKFNHEYEEWEWETPHNAGPPPPE